jgi:hypothetical protein
VTVTKLDRLGRSTRGLLDLIEPIGAAEYTQHKNRERKPAPAKIPRRLGLRFRARVSHPLRIGLYRFDHASDHERKLNLVRGHIGAFFIALSQLS